MNWYYAENNQRQGPFDEAAWQSLVTQGKIKPDMLVWHEELDHWTPFAQLPKSSSAPAVPAVPEQPLPKIIAMETPEEFAARILQRDFRVDIGACMSRSWNLLRANFWPLVGATLVIYAIIVGGSDLPLIGIAMPFAFKGVFSAGLFLFFLKTIRGQNPEFAELFSGFKNEVLGQLALKTLVTTLLMAACFAPGFICLASSGAVKPDGTVNPALIDSPLVLGGLGLFLLGSLPACYFGFCWIFALPLIIDRRMKFGAAMRLSRKKVLQHPWRISLLLIVAGFISVLGIFALFIGVIFTLPLYVGALAWLYTDVFDDASA